MVRSSASAPDVYQAHLAGTSAHPVVLIEGSLDSGSFANVLQLVSSIDLHDAHSVTIDLEGVTFIDAAGLRVLMTLRQRTRAAGSQLIVSRPSQPVCRLLSLCGLDRSFDFETERAVRVPVHQSAA